MEVQITKEYLGESTHSPISAPMWSEVLRSRHLATAASDIARCARHDHGHGGRVELGSDRNWTGSDFDQANWYAFGRLAWDPDRSRTSPRNGRASLGERPARRSTRRRNDDGLARSGRRLDDAARPRASDGDATITTVPGPGSTTCTAPLWNPTYYHRADAAASASTGRRTAATPSPNTRLRSALLRGPEVRAGQAPPVVPPRALDLSDAFRRDGVGLALVAALRCGAAPRAAMKIEGALVTPFVDAERHARSLPNSTAVVEAKWWRDASVAYCQSFRTFRFRKGTNRHGPASRGIKTIDFDTVPAFSRQGPSHQPSVSST